MGRRKLSYSVRTRSGSIYWQYRIEGMILYRPSPVKIRLRSGRPCNRAEAEEWAAEEWRRKGGSEGAARAHDKTLKDFLAPYYVPGLCPHMTRVLGDKGRY